MVKRCPIIEGVKTSTVAMKTINTTRKTPLRPLRKYERDLKDYHYNHKTTTEAKNKNRYKKIGIKGRPQTERINERTESRERRELFQKHEMGAGGSEVNVLEAVFVSPASRFALEM